MGRTGDQIGFRQQTTPVAWLRGVSVLNEKNVCDAGLKVFLNQSYPRMNKHGFPWKILEMMAFPHLYVVLQEGTGVT